MSFLPEAQREIDARAQNDAVRIVLQYLMQNAVGHNNAVPFTTLAQCVAPFGLHLEKTVFQQTVLAESRRSGFFIGSSNKGYFLIDTQDDARAMQKFYEDRIQSEQQHLEHLKKLANAVGWSLG